MLRKSAISLDFFDWLLKENNQCGLVDIVLLENKRLEHCALLQPRQNQLGHFTFQSEMEIYAVNGLLFNQQLGQLYLKIFQIWLYQEQNLTEQWMLNYN